MKNTNNELWIFVYTIICFVKIQTHRSENIHKGYSIEGLSNIFLISINFSLLVDNNY